MPDMFYSCGIASDDGDYSYEVQGNQGHMGVGGTVVNLAKEPKIVSILTHCPKCNAPMQKRAGRFGDFLFCPRQKHCGMPTVTVK